LRHQRGTVRKEEVVRCYSVLQLTVNVLHQLQQAMFKQIVYVLYRWGDELSRVYTN